MENIKEIMDGLDLGALLPSMSSIENFAALFGRIAVMVGPFVVLALGLFYFLAAPREATFSAGYRFKWGMRSVQAWQFMQKAAGAVWILLGLSLCIAMCFLCADFPEKEAMDVLWTALVALLWEAVAMGLSCGLINCLVLLRYDRKGRRRISWIELFRA